VEDSYVYYHLRRRATDEQVLRRVQFSGRGKDQDQMDDVLIWCYRKFGPTARKLGIQRPARRDNFCGVGRVTLEWGDGDRDTVIWMPGLETMISGQADMDTDASLVHYTVQADGRRSRDFFFDGSFLAFT